PRCSLLSLHDALPISALGLGCYVQLHPKSWPARRMGTAPEIGHEHDVARGAIPLLGELALVEGRVRPGFFFCLVQNAGASRRVRSEEHTSELQSRVDL